MMKRRASLRSFWAVAGSYSNKTQPLCYNNVSSVSMAKLLPKQAASSYSLSFYTCNKRLLHAASFSRNQQAQAKIQPLNDDMFKVAKFEIADSRKYVKISWKDGHISRFHASWLRFNCHCRKCKRNITGESNVDRSSLPDDLLVNSVKINADQDGAYEGDMEIWLEGETVADHVTTLPLEWLRRHCYSDVTLDAMMDAKVMKFRDPAKHPLPTIEYKDTRDDQGRFNWFKLMMDVGFSVVKNVPTQDGIVLEIAEEISPLVYGTYEKMFNVTDTGSTANLAYTSVALPLHMDVVHLEAAPGIQLLHALEFDEVVEGGNSILIDMFEAVRVLRERHPDDFRVLTRVPVTFSITDYEKVDPIHVLHRKPIIQVDYDDRVVACAWNPGTEQPLRVRERDVDDFFRAYKKLHAITTDPKLQYNFRLHKGDLLLFNNRRFLHSRDAYKSNGGRRLLQGTYCSMEELRNKYVILGRKLGHNVVDTIIGNGSAV